MICKKCGAQIVIWRSKGTVNCSMCGYRKLIEESKEKTQDDEGDK